MPEITNRKEDAVPVSALRFLLNCWRVDLGRSKEQHDYFLKFDPDRAMRHLENSATKQLCIDELEALIQGNDSIPREEGVSE